MRGAIAPGGALAAHLLATSWPMSHDGGGGGLVGGGGGRTSDRVRLLRSLSHHIVANATRPTPTPMWTRVPIMQFRDCTTHRTACPYVDRYSCTDRHTYVSYRQTALAFPIGVRTPIISFSAHDVLSADPDKLTKWAKAHPDERMTVETARNLRGGTSAPKIDPDAWRGRFEHACKLLDDLAEHVFRRPAGRQAAAIATPLPAHVRHSRRGHDHELGLIARSEHSISSRDGRGEVNAVRTWR